MLVDYHDFGNGTMILVFDLTVRGECRAVYSEKAGKLTHQSQV